MNNNTPRRSPRLCRSSTRFDPISRRSGRSRRRGNQEQQEQEPLVPPSSSTGAGETIPSRPLLRRSRRLNSQQQFDQQQQQQEREHRQRRSARQPSPSSLLRNVVEVPANMTGPAMLADVITQAVVNAYRERRNNSNSSSNSDDDPDHYASTTSSAAAPVPTETTTTGAAGAGAAVFDPSSLFLDSALPPEANSEENSFFRIVRMPLVVPSDASATVTSSSPEVVMPMYIVGYRTQQEVTSTPPDHFQQAAPAPTPVSPAASPASSPEAQQAATADGVRRSQRIRDLQQRQQQEEDERRRNQRSETDNRRYTVSRWIIYFISGMDNNNPSYDDLVAAWQAEHRNTGLTVEQINSCAPQQLFTPQVAASIVGGNEQCHVCLEKFELLENVRVLTCQHGFHQECIDKWLIEAQNRCPLCRETAVPPSLSS